LYQRKKERTPAKSPIKGGIREKKNVEKEKSAKSPAGRQGGVGSEIASREGNKGEEEETGKETTKTRKHGQSASYMGRRTPPPTPRRSHQQQEGDMNGNYQIQITKEPIQKKNTRRLGKQEIEVSGREGTRPNV